MHRRSREDRRCCDLVQHRMGRNYLWHREGDAANAVLAAVGYNFRRLIHWLRLFLCQILPLLIVRLQPMTA
jgi:transposase, IS5 family